MEVVLRYLKSEQHLRRNLHFPNNSFTTKIYCITAMVGIYMSTYVLLGLFPYVYIFKREKGINQKHKSIKECITFLHIAYLLFLLEKKIIHFFIFKMLTKYCKTVCYLFAQQTFIE